MQTSIHIPRLGGTRTGMSDVEMNMCDTYRGTYTYYSSYGNFKDQNENILNWRSYSNVNTAIKAIFAALSVEETRLYFTSKSINQNKCIKCKKKRTYERKIE